MQPENRIQDAFACISAEEELKASTKEFLQAIRRRNEAKAGLSRGKLHFGSFRRMYSKAVYVTAGMICAVFAAACGIGFHFMLYVPVSYVSIDVNPSMELELNRLDRVISAKAYNEDGEKVLGSITLGGMYYTDAITLLMESSAMEPYLAGDGDMVFTVASGDGKRERELIIGIKNSPGCAGYGGRSVGADIGLAEEAHENGFSVGKYMVYMLLQQYDPSVTPSDCHGMSMSEMHGMIREHEGHGAGSGGDGSCGHGSNGSHGSHCR